LPPLQVSLAHATTATAVQHQQQHQCNCNSNISTLYTLETVTLIFFLLPLNVSVF